MSTIKVTNVSHPSAASPAIVLDADGDATYAGVHDFSAATVTGAPQGLVHIATETFSAVSSVSLNDVFTSTYDYYRVLFEFVPSSATTHTMRLRTSGTDNTDPVYAHINQRNYSTAITTYAGSASTLVDFTYGPWGTEQYFSEFEFRNPVKASNTGWLNRTTSHQTSGVQMFTSGFHKSTTVFDGFSLFCAAGNFTGTIRVYGYRNEA